MEELDLLQEHIERDFYTLQASGQESQPLSMLLHGHVLLVARRISKQNYADGPYALYLQYLMCFPPIHSKWDVRYGDDFGEDNNLALSTCLLILEQVNAYDPENISSLAFRMLRRTLRLMSTLFITLVEKPPGTPGREHLSFANLLAPPKFFITILKYFEAPRYISFVLWDGFDSFGELAIRFIYVVDSMSPHLTSERINSWNSTIQTLFAATFQNVPPQFFTRRIGTPKTLSQILMQSSSSLNFLSNLEPTRTPLMTVV
jgi:hypothetical protein